MVIETTIEPRPPYSLALSARMRSDATRFLRNGVLTMVYEAGSAPALAAVRQRPDGSLHARVECAEPEAAVDRLRFVLAADDDHRPFLQRFERDRLLADPIRSLRGLRPIRTATVTHALLKALCGQLIQAKAARLLEARLIRFASRPHQGLSLPPARSTFAGYSPAELARHGLVARKSTALIRLTRELELERLHSVSTEAVASRLERERGLGPWSTGMVCVHGLGRYDRGLVGDLGLVKLCSALRGRRADADDTRELLEPYHEWAGLASVYLLAARPMWSSSATTSPRSATRSAGRPRSRPHPARGR